MSTVLLVADDEELLRLFADALFRLLFVGVETPRRECLEEVHKAHNLDRPLEERLRAISRFGIVPFLVTLYFFFQNVNRLLPPNL